jgi:hypothetical protein
MPRAPRQRKLIRREDLRDWCTAAMLADYLGVSKSRIHRLAQNPECPKWQEKPRAIVLFPRDRWLAWFEAQTYWNQEKASNSRENFSPWTSDV